MSVYCIELLQVFEYCLRSFLAEILVILRVILKILVSKTVNLGSLLIYWSPRLEGELLLVVLEVFINRYNRQFNHVT